MLVSGPSSEVSYLDTGTLQAAGHLLGGLPHPVAPPNGALPPCSASQSSLHGRSGPEPMPSAPTSFALQWPLPHAPRCASGYSSASVSVTCIGGPSTSAVGGSGGCWTRTAPGSPPMHWEKERGPLLGIFAWFLFRASAFGWTPFGRPSTRNHRCAAGDHKGGSSSSLTQVGGLALSIALQS
jgi:hypothetical protein